MRREKGLTLIEILVAMGILSLLVAILSSVFTISLRGWKKSENILEAASEARIVLERMSREISTAIIKSDGSIYCIGYDKTAPSGFRTNSIGDEFYFIAPLNPDDDQKSALCEAGYWLDGNGTNSTNDDVLRRFYVTDGRRTGSPAYFDFNFATPGGRDASDQLATKITDLQFLFYDQNNMEDTTWDSRTKGALPARIKITVKVETGEGTGATNPDFISREFSTEVSFY